MAIQDYEIIKQIGSGGMGAVYLARDPRLDRLVAIKKIKVPTGISKELHSEVVQRFYREARAIANLNHPNIVTIYELGEDPDTKECFMVMEYLEGKSIEQLLEEQKFLPVNLVLKMGIQISEALHYMHQKQLVHRDIKPGNLINCDSGMVKLTDFGLVRIDDNLDLTRQGTLLGSVLYMSPEQIEDPKNVDHRVDMYAFGVTMYQSLSGEFPYIGDNVWEVITQITGGAPIPLTRSNPAVSRDLEKIIMKTVSQKKEDRYSDMLELQEALINYNMLHVQTLISPLSYARISGRSDPGRSRTADYQAPVVQEPGKKNYNQELTVTEIVSPVESEPEIYQAGPPKSNLAVSSPARKAWSFGEEEEIKTGNIDTFAYPEKFDPETLSQTEKQEIILRLKQILVKLAKEAETAKNNYNLLHDLSENLVEETKELYGDIKSMTTDYNLSVAGQDATVDYKELKRKIDLKKLQRASKEKELLFLKEKADIYQQFSRAKKLREEITAFMIDRLLESEKTGFFSSVNSIFKLSEKQTDNAKSLIQEKINDMLRIDKFVSGLKNNIEKFHKLLAGAKEAHYSQAASVIRFLPKNSSIEVKLFDDLESNSLLEIDLDNSEIFYVYCNIIHNNKVVPKVQYGNIVLLKSDAFNDEAKNKIKSNSPIFKGRVRLFRKSILDEELKAHNNLIPLIENLKASVENNLSTSFALLISMFTELGSSDLNLAPETKQLAMVKTNKIKRAALELKKEFELSEEPVLREYAKYFSNLIPSLTKFPILLRNYENEMKAKKDQRKKLIQSTLVQISKATPEILKDQMDNLMATIQSFRTSDIPSSLVDLLIFYLLSKAKLPTEVSKNHILEKLNKERDLLATTEIDWICRLLNLKYNRERGFILKVGL
jgi:serine/threonine protein kinase